MSRSHPEDDNRRIRSMITNLSEAVHLLESSQEVHAVQNRLIALTRQLTGRISFLESIEAARTTAPAESAFGKLTAVSSRNVNMRDFFSILKLKLNKHNLDILQFMRMLGGKEPADVNIANLIAEMKTAAGQHLTEVVDVYRQLSHVYHTVYRHARLPDEEQLCTGLSHIMPDLINETWNAVCDTFTPIYKWLA